MIRVLVFLVVLAAVTLGLSWMADHPGEMVIVWQGIRIETSVPVALAIFAALVIICLVIWRILSTFFHLPFFLSHMIHGRRRAKGLAAISRGMIAAGAGDLPTARKAGELAAKFVPREPLTLLLKAQVAQLTGNRAAAQASFEAMASRPETRLLGLRGLHVEASRNGDHEAAHQYSSAAHAIAPLQWAGEAVLNHQVTQADWKNALRTVENSLASRMIDKTKADRLCAVLKTALAMETDGSEALSLAASALKKAPDLIPAATVAATQMIKSGSAGKAARLIEKTWRSQPHPDLAKLYLGLRAGDSLGDRLKKARTLASQFPSHPESRLLVARAALDAGQWSEARSALESLTLAINDNIHEPPGVKACMLMAELEQKEKGSAGNVAEWLARAATAPREPAWTADGVVYEHWMPASPVTGRLDAFIWQSPAIQAQHDMPAWLKAPSQEFSQSPDQPSSPLQESPVPDEAPVQALKDEAVIVQPESQAQLPAEVPAKAEDVSNSQAAQNVVEEINETVVPFAVVRPEKAGPVIFPLPAAPDDPGTAGQEPDFETAPRPRNLMSRIFQTR